MRWAWASMPLLSTLATMMLPFPQALAQQPGSHIILFSDVDFAGKSVRYDGPVEDIDVGYPLRSARTSGGRWQVCSRNHFRGACMIVYGAEANLKNALGFFSKVSSLRPVDASASAARNIAPAASAPSPPAVPPPIPDAGATSGDTAQFYRLPKRAGVPLPTCKADEERCGQNLADAFCREQGWEKATYWAPKMRGGDSIVGDILCTGPAR